MIKDIKNIDRKIHRVDGKLFELIEVKNDDGETVRQFDFPLKVELHIHDFLEIIVGASILAVPVAFTEEVWDMGDELPWANTILLSSISIIFIGCFVYFSSYRMHLQLFRKEFILRILSIFLLSMIVVGLLLTIVNKCPWLTDFDLAMKRTMIGAFPASMSATVTDQMNS
jgi:uncharacterized membrane protein